MTQDLKQAIQQKARQLGFILAGVVSPEPPPQFHRFDAWLEAGMHGEMAYLATERSRSRRADPRQILPECSSILVLGIPYAPVSSNQEANIASYALGEDYHDVLPKKLHMLVEFIKEELGHPFPHKIYTDTGPLLERELGQRAGLGWIGKNTCLINPKHGSTFFLAEVLLGIELESDAPFQSDHCGSCTRCLDACPTACILPGRILDARRCISYLTIELKGPIPQDLRPLMGNWIFGCDVCQQVCPWNRFAPEADPAFKTLIPIPLVAADFWLSESEFKTNLGRTPVRRAKRVGYLRNLCVAFGNNGDGSDLPTLEKISRQEPAIREHAEWAIRRLHERSDKK